MSLDDFGEGAEALRSLREGHTPLDYQMLIDSIGGEIQNLGTEVVDGKTITRLRVTTDFGTLMDSIADSVSDNGLDDPFFAADLSGPMTLDIMIDPQTLLPYKFEANGELAMNGQSAELRDDVPLLQLQRHRHHARTPGGRHSRSTRASATHSETSVPQISRSAQRTAKGRTTTPTSRSRSSPGSP